MASFSTFVFRHCRWRCRKNPRIKGYQCYCGRLGCPQSRKNRWERDKLHRDSFYRQTRQSSKKKWYSMYCGDRYQAAYRASHPDYVRCNCEKQRLRSLEIIVNWSGAKVVKTDALSSVSFVGRGFLRSFTLPFPKGCKDGRVNCRTAPL